MLLERLTAGGPLAGQGQPVLEFALPPVATSARDARHALADYCQAHAVPADLVDSGLLSISELVTNAVLHAGTPTMVWAEYDAGHLAVAVLDGDATLPELMTLDDGQREGGRGIAIVDQLGATWGLIRTALGKIVWVDLTAAPVSALPNQRG